MVDILVPFAEEDGSCEGGSFVAKNREMFCEARDPDGKDYVGYNSRIVW